MGNDASVPDFFDDTIPSAFDSAYDAVAPVA